MAEKEKPRRTKKTVGKYIREWIEIIIVAFMLAMFIRTFVIELFRIPSGSMIPTLIGARIAEVDIDEDGDRDLVVDTGQGYEVFEREGDNYINVSIRRAFPLDKELEIQRKLHWQKDMILVNKSAFWFRLPKRGEVIVFRVPEPEFQPDKPIYIKRVVALPNEKVEINSPHLFINGKPVTHPPVFKYLKYTNSFGFYHKTVPEGEVYVFGDNSLISADSRKWGGVPIENIKGKAFFRYYPFHKMKFIK
ncbi:MAG: signal peptidase I [Candidatus Sumerlaeia bacterium]|nr:signal peptidase I [Candidatus Sumerlaeia bacterium]